MATKKNAPSWSDVKTKLVDFDRAGLLGLLQDLYVANYRPIGRSGRTDGVLLRTGSGFQQ